ncbi:hypothetical protein NT6N_03480 [Oceaniferula spumae]|uniref:NodB homology domain-containing protein n=1 Tax=Oceaniferula spumae TaxID=2979115 RepID=A0AAT9FH80_9BACT
MNPTLRKFFHAGMTVCSATGLTKIARRKQTGACILMYHGFTQGQSKGLENHSRLHLDIEGFRHTAKMFEKHYNVISLQNLTVMMEAGVEIPPNTVVLTFDDGYASNYHLALPVLEEFGLHATVFASTGFIEGESFQWPDRIEYAIDHCSERVLHLEFEGLPETLNLATIDKKKAALVLLDRALKLIPQERHLESLAHIEERAGAALADDPSPADIYKPMTWDQVRMMDQSKYASIGAHTHIHAILGNCSPAFARQDMRHCTELLEQKAGITNPAFAYPNGQPGDFNADTQQILRELGYSVALTTVMGFNQKHQDLMELKRMGTPRNGYQADTICSGFMKHVKEPIVQKISNLIPATS